MRADENPHWTLASYNSRLECGGGGDILPVRLGRRTDDTSTSGRSRPVRGWEAVARPPPVPSRPGGRGDRPAGRPIDDRRPTSAGLGPSLRPADRSGGRGGLECAAVIILAPQRSGVDTDGQADAEEGGIATAIST